MDEGYLQNKIREQADEIREIKNKIKELETKLIWSKKGYDEAKEFLFKAGDIKNFKNNMIQEVDKAISKNFSDRVKFIQSNNQKFLDHGLTMLGEAILEKYHRESCGLMAALGKIFTEKRMLSVDDIKKIFDYQEEYLKEHYGID